MWYYVTLFIPSMSKIALKLYIPYSRLASEHKTKLLSKLLIKTPILAQKSSQSVCKRKKINQEHKKIPQLTFHITLDLIKFNNSKKKYCAFSFHLEPEFSKENK